jgi:putative glycerol-1-phosphate prenyltransferase
MRIYNYLIKTIEKKGAAYVVLIDPDKLINQRLNEFVEYAEESGVDAFFIGGSLLIDGDLRETISDVKKHTKLPVIIFPGGVDQVIPTADAILYLSLISGRNPEQLIGKHVLAAPAIKKHGIEPISTGYMLIESGRATTAEYMSGSRPIPRNKPEIAASTALAAEYLGMKLVYLEAGSGAERTVPNEMINLVSNTCSIPVVVGGGIKTAMTAREKVENGASIVVTGNFFEEKKNWNKIKDFAQAVHINSPAST